jgi:hypothetical protein
MRLLSVAHPCLSPEDSGSAADGMTSIPDHDQSLPVCYQSDGNGSTGPDCRIQ